MTPVELARELGLTRKGCALGCASRSSAALEREPWGDLDEDTIEEAHRRFAGSSSLPVARQLTTQTASRESGPVHMTGTVEVVRTGFKPSWIRILFVGQNAPAGGDSSTTAIRTSTYR